MGAAVRADKDGIQVAGRANLQGAPVVAADLRGGAALVLASLAAEGVTTITGLPHLDRGYERMVEKLITLGAEVTRTDSSPTLELAECPGGATR